MGYLIDANSGAVVQTAAAFGDSYTFTELPDGDYLVYTGEDAGQYIVTVREGL